MTEDQTLLANPWALSNSTTGNAPFDQKFYLILNVAVGSRNGWFLYVSPPPLHSSRPCPLRMVKTGDVADL